MDIRITELPVAGPIAGDELVPVVQNGQTVKTTVDQIVAQPSQTQEFLTVVAEPTLPNSRYIQAGTGLLLTDNGPQNPVNISVSGLLLDFLQLPTGIVARTDVASIASREIETSGTGIQVTNGDGVAGNPTISFTGLTSQLSTLVGKGMIAVDGTSANLVTIQGTADEVSVSSGDGAVPGPVIGIADNPILPGSAGTVVPAGTTAQRGATNNGKIRYNIDTNRYEGVQNGSWTRFGIGDGTVTSVALSGGTTGLTVSGSPITSSGTFVLQGYPTLAGNLAGGAANRIAYQSGANTTAFAIAPTVNNTFLKWTGSGFDWALAPGTGTVTSVNASGGTTGMSFLGGPIVTDGTLTLTGILSVNNGGTGSATPSGARINLGAAASATTISAGTGLTGGGDLTANRTLAIANTGVIAASYGSASQTLTATVNAQGQLTNLAATSIAIANTQVSGLGTMSTQNANNVSITGGSITGITDLAVADGGTGASDAAGARANLNAAVLGANNDITSMSAVTGSISSPTFIQMGNGATTPLAAGRLWYDNVTGSLNFGMGGGQITQQVGEEFFRYGKASVAISDANLTAIYKTGTVGASGVITFAPTVAGIARADQILGIATEPIAKNGFGRITTSGVVRGLDTTGSVYGEVWADNDDIWYNPVTGGLTKTEPVAPNIKLRLGTVIKAGTGGSGSFFVGLGSTSTLGGTDSNVQFGTLSNGDVIIYDTALQYWKNAAQSTLAAGSATNATNTVNTAITASSTNADYYITVVSSNTGNLPQLVATGLTANPSTGKITGGISGGTF